MLSWLQGLTFWHWWLVGIVLVVLEIALPGIWLLWLGLGAVATGLILLVLPALPWQAQFVVFCALSVISVIGGRVVLRRSSEGSDHPHLNRRAAQHVGQSFTLDEATRGGRGHVRIGDTNWRVELSPPGEDLAAGTRIKVVGTDGTTLQIAPDPPAGS